jgi:SAM-dependent methyltransferase
MFEANLGQIASPDRELLELGCGGSAFLPYFASEYGFRVSGIDYSATGCDLARRLCEEYGVTADVVCADFFEAPAALFDRFDAVVSFGVVEHFSDTRRTISAFLRFVKPGGLLLTVVPNMSGLTGLAQRALAPEVFAVHEQIDVHRLRDAHDPELADVIDCRHFLACNFGVVNLGSRPGNGAKLAYALLRGLTGVVWALEVTAGALPATESVSPYLLAVAPRRAPEGQRRGQCRE